MPIVRYTCVHCGIVTRVEQWQSYCVRACRGSYEMVDESAEVEIIILIDPVDS